MFRFSMFTILLLWILFSLASSQPSLKTASSQRDNTTCSPFSLLVIWHASNGEDSAFVEQKRLIIRLLLIIPEGTEIQVTAINTQLNHLLYMKKNKATDWIYSISMYIPKILETHSIKGQLINETVFSFRQKNDRKEVAELFLLVVNEKTLMEKVLETIENTKRCVVFTGLNPPPPLWTSLATDRQHIVLLNMTSESIEANINGAADTILDILCEDSSLICDTDKFWTRKGCVSCSYICSADSKKHADECPDLCPYYRQLPSKNADDEVEETVTGKRCKQTHAWIPISISLVALVVMVCLIVCACFDRKHLRQKIYRTNERDKNSSRDPSNELMEVEVVQLFVKEDINIEMPRDAAVEMQFMSKKA